MQYSSGERKDVACHIYDGRPYTRPDWEELYSGEQRKDFASHIYDGRPYTESGWEELSVVSK